MLSAPHFVYRIIIEAIHFLQVKKIKQKQNNKPTPVPRKFEPGFIRKIWPFKTQLYIFYLS